MSPTRVLYLGGTGTISSACVRRSIDLGHEVTVLTRGAAQRDLPDGVRMLRGDVRDAESLRAAIAGAEFDAVADFLSFTPEHVTAMLAQFEHRTAQYVFVSSASAYQKPVPRTPVTESTPLGNPFWQYSRDKAACEALLAERDVPTTIVRPSHTYDERRLPNIGRWTDIARMRAGEPVVVPGDGTSQWTLTDSADFAVGFSGLLGLERAIGETVHITTDEAPTWNQIYAWLAEAAGVAEPRFVHVASETIARAHPDLGPGLLGDKSHSMVFDNARIKALVPEFQARYSFADGAARSIAWAEAAPERHLVDPVFYALSDRLVAHALGVLPG